MGLFGVRTSRTRQQKRLEMFITNWNAASTPDQQLYQASAYLRAVCRGFDDPAHKTRVAWEIFSHAARFDGVEVDLQTEFRHSP